MVWPEPGASIVALWDADSRYTALKAGYHGGASLAEVTIRCSRSCPSGRNRPKGGGSWGTSDRSGGLRRQPEGHRCRTSTPLGR
ncbi:hypothetical protein GCM10010340_11440 [Streptomyces griseoloalbus]|nr:hypothetical protein GCM10010340_11440 [Streptomyces albaduncus]